MKLVIDATNLRVGRMVTVAAKAAIKGDSVDIVNCEKAVFTGTKEYLLGKYQAGRDRGRPTKGPFIHRMPDRFVRRIVRGMLPYKTPRGRDAFARVMCYMGNPKEQKATTIPEASIEKSSATKFMTVQELCKLLGGNQ